MQAVINFNDYADISSFKQFLETFKGIKDFKIFNDSEEFESEISNEEYEKKFDELLEKSSRQIDEGQGREMTTKYLDEIFSRWK